MQEFSLAIPTSRIQTKAGRSWVTWLTINAQLCRYIFITTSFWSFYHHHTCHKQGNGVVYFLLFTLIFWLQVSLSNICFPVVSKYSMGCRALNKGLYLHPLKEYWSVKACSDLLWICCDQQLLQSIAVKIIKFQLFAAI